ncbi:hypothetical protein EPN90_02820 [Patescibacteria group bacterium]|nr:MAG: hypothetical protein EPN90_02820 [Patescibacteria group bacterium]
MTGIRNGGPKKSPSPNPAPSAGKGVSEFRSGVFAAEAGTVLVESGTPCTGIFLLLSGALAVRYADGTSRLCEVSSGAGEGQKRHVVEAQYHAVETGLWTGRVTVEKPSKLLFLDIKTLLGKQAALQGDLAQMREENLDLRRRLKLLAGEAERRAALGKELAEQIRLATRLREVNRQLNARNGKFLAELQGQDRQLKRRDETIAELEAERLRREAEVAEQLAEKDERIRSLQTRLEAAEAPSPSAIGAVLIEEDEVPQRNTYEYGIAPLERVSAPPRDTLPSAGQARPSRQAKPPSLPNEPPAAQPSRGLFTTLLGLPAVSDELDGPRVEVRMNAEPIALDFDELEVPSDRPTLVGVAPASTPAPAPAKPPSKR